MHVQARKHLRVAGGVALFLALMASSGMTQVGRRGDAPAVPAPRDFAEFLAARDLVVDGVVVGVDQVRRTPLGTCGTTGLGPYRATDLRISVTRVWHGTADDSTLLITVLGRPVFSSGPVVPGTKVLAWAFRDCNDGWRLWGQFCVVTEGGKILGPAGSDQSAYALVGRDESEPTSYTELDSALSLRPGLRASQALFDGTSAVAILRLVQTVRRGVEGFTYECDSVGWALGTGARVPRFIDFPRVPDCFPEIFPGDSLVVPLPSSFNGDRLSIDGCPRAFQIKKDFAVGFGVPVSFLNYALRSDAGQLRVRAFIAKDE